MAWFAAHPPTSFHTRVADQHRTIQWTYAAHSSPALQYPPANHKKPLRSSRHMQQYSQHRDPSEEVRPRVIPLGASGYHLPEQRTTQPALVPAHSNSTSKGRISVIGMQGQGPGQGTVSVPVVPGPGQLLRPDLSRFVFASMHPASTGGGVAAPAAEGEDGEWRGDSHPPRLPLPPPVATQRYYAGAQQPYNSSMSLSTVSTSKAATVRVTVGRDARACAVPVLIDMGAGSDHGEEQEGAPSPQRVGRPPAPPARASRRGSTPRATTAAAALGTGRPLYPHLGEHRRLHTTGVTPASRRQSRGPVPRSRDPSPASRKSSAARRRPSAPPRLSASPYSMTVMPPRQVQSQGPTVAWVSRLVAHFMRAFPSTRSAAQPPPPSSVADAFAAFLVARHGAIGWRAALDRVARVLPAMSALSPRIAVFRQYFVAAGNDDETDGNHDHDHDGYDGARRALVDFRLLCALHCALGAGENGTAGDAVRRYLPLSSSGALPLLLSSLLSATVVEEVVAVPVGSGDPPPALRFLPLRRRLSPAEVSAAVGLVLDWVGAGEDGTAAATNALAFDTIGCVDADVTLQALVEAVNCVCALHPAEAARRFHEPVDEGEEEVEDDDDWRWRHEGEGAPQAAGGGPALPPWTPAYQRRQPEPNGTLASHYFEDSGVCTHPTAMEAGQPAAVPDSNSNSSSSPLRASSPLPPRRVGGPSPDDMDRYRGGNTALRLNSPPPPPPPLPPLAYSVTGEDDNGINDALFDPSDFMAAARTAVAVLPAPRDDADQRIDCDSKSGRGSSSSDDEREEDGPPLRPLREASRAGRGQCSLSVTPVRLASPPPVPVVAAAAVPSLQGKLAGVFAALSAELAERKQQQHHQRRRSLATAASQGSREPAPAAGSSSTADGGRIELSAEEAAKLTSLDSVLEQLRVRRCQRQLE